MNVEVLFDMIFFDARRSSGNGIWKALKSGYTDESLGTYIFVDRCVGGGGTVIGRG